MSVEDAMADQISAYALDLLDDAERRDMEARLEREPALRAELAQVRAALDGLDEAWPEVEPSSEGRDRLLAALDTGADRFGPFIARLAERMSLTVEAMRRHLDMALDPNTTWTETGVPGVRFVHFEAGPPLAGADTGFVRFDAGAMFPPHRHHGRELTFILEGTLRFSTGEVLQPGDEVVMAADTRHFVQADASTPVLYVTFHEGFTVESG